MSNQRRSSSDSYNITSNVHVDNGWILIVSVWDFLTEAVHCVPRTVPLLFLHYLWFVLTDFNNVFTVTIRNYQPYIWNKIQHLILTALPLHLTKVCSKFQHFLYFYEKVRSIWANQSCIRKLYTVLWISLVQGARCLTPFTAFGQ